MMLAMAGKANRKQAIILLLFIGVIGGVVGYTLGEFFELSEQGIGAIQALPLWQTLVTLILTLLFVWYFSILIHEFGHLVVGLSLRFRLMYFMVGPLMVQKAGPSFQVGWNSNFNLAGGFTVMAFPTQGELRNKMLLYIAGGPLASLLLTLLSAQLFVALGGMVAMIDATSLFHFCVHAALLFGAMFSGFTFLISMVPQQMGVIQSDGARLRNLLNQGPKAEADLAYLKQYQATLSGIRPREYDSSRLHWLSKNEDQPGYQPFAHLYLYYHSIDCGEIEEARDHLAMGIGGASTLPDLLQQIFTYEWAFFQSFYGEPELYQDTLWPNKMKTLMEPGTQARMLAIRFWRAGDLALAQKHLKEAQLKIPQNMDKGLGLLEMDWANQLERLMEKEPAGYYHYVGKDNATGETAK